MGEFCIKVDIPEQFKEKFEIALAKAIKSFSEELEFAMVESILSKSKLTEKQALELGDEVKEAVWKKHQEKGW